MPIDIKERLFWEKIIFEEIKKTESKAKYIDEEYRKLAKTDINGKELASIVEFLTPDQGFLIRAFVGDNKPTITSIKQWKKEYEQPINNKKDQVSFYSNFLMETALISDEEYDPIKKSINKTISDKREKVMSGIFPMLLKEKEGNSADSNWLNDLEVQVQNMKKIFLARTLRLQSLFDSGFLDNPEIIKDKNTIIQEVIKRSSDFNYHFLQFISEAIGFRASGYPIAEEYMKDRQTLLIRSLNLDDTAEDLVEALSNKESPDYDALFSKDYKKSHFKKERIRKRYFNLGLEDNPGQSPLEDETVLLFQKIMNNSPTSENLIFRTDTKQFQRLCSSCIRVLLWSNESGKPLMDFGAIRMFIYNMYKSRTLPTEYDSLVKDGSLGINPDLEISVQAI